MNPADVSLAVRTNWMGLCLSASISGNTGPLGTPKTQRTPASCNVRTMTSLLFMIDVGACFSSMIEDRRIEDGDPLFSILYLRFLIPDAHRIDGVLHGANDRQ